MEVIWRLQETSRMEEKETLQNMKEEIDGDRTYI
jgi:hypothetical protein